MVLTETDVTMSRISKNREKYMNFHNWSKIWGLTEVDVTMSRISKNRAKHPGQS